MTSFNKKQKCKRTLLDRGGEKGSFFKMKRDAMYHKKDRKNGKDTVRKYIQEKENE